MLPRDFLFLFFFYYFMKLVCFSRLKKWTREKTLGLTSKCSLVSMCNSVQNVEQWSLNNSDTKWRQCFSCRVAIVGQSLVLNDCFATTAKLWNSCYGMLHSCWATHCTVMEVLRIVSMQCILGWSEFYSFYLICFIHNTWPV